MKRGTFPPLMVIRSRVRGLTPWRSPRSATWNLPKPVKLISPPDLRVSVIVPSTDSTASVASLLERPVRLATWSMNSCFVTLPPSSVGKSGATLPMPADFRPRSRPRSSRARAGSGHGRSPRTGPSGPPAPPFDPLEHRHEVRGDRHLAGGLGQLSLPDQAPGGARRRSCPKPDSRRSAAPPRPSRRARPRRPSAGRRRVLARGDEQIRGGHRRGRAVGARAPRCPSSRARPCCAV